jgi:hypothetical protein
MLDQSPRLDVAAAERVARDQFGIDGNALPLTSERDQNFLIIANDGRRIVLKIANAREDERFLAAQQAALAHLTSRVNSTPRVLEALAGCGKSEYFDEFAPSSRKRQGQSSYEGRFLRAFSPVNQRSGAGCVLRRSRAGPHGHTPARMSVRIRTRL